MLEHVEWGISLVIPQKLQSWLVMLKMACWLPLLHVQPTFYDLTTFPCWIKTIKTSFLVFYIDLLSINGLLLTPLCLKPISFRASFYSLVCLFQILSFLYVHRLLLLCRGLTANFLYNKTNSHSYTGKLLKK